MYDQFGFYAENYQGGPAPGEEASAGGPHFDFGGFDFGGAGGTSFRDLFSQFFRGGRGTEGPEREAGNDLEYQIRVSFWEAVRGTVKKISITRLDSCASCQGTGAAGGAQVCPACGGKGTVQQTSGRMRFNISCPRCAGTGRLRTPCGACGGEGRVQRAETLDVRIPAGVHTGSRVRVPGHGNAGTLGAPPGDLYILLEVAPHPFFERQGDDLHTVVPITISEATLGAKIEVPTIDGRSQVRIPPGTSSGRRLRLREKGVPSARNGRRGDQYVELQVVVPKPTDERVRNLLRELDKIAPEDPRKDLFAQASA
jgi:molecular chaperone DnaJ